MLKLLTTEGWLDTLRAFGRRKPVFGTCAGMVLMGTEIDDARVTPLGWLPIRVLRNAYGSQVHSFRDVGTVEGIGGHPEMEMVFIRAPKFVPLADEVIVLATCRGEPVAARYGAHVTTAFHPELTDDDRIHRFWLGLVAARKQDPAPVRPQEKTA
jgi:5'-phosphate synthase pdxT subunit